MPLTAPVNVLCYYDFDVNGPGPVRVGFIRVDESDKPIMRFARAVFALDDGATKECFIPGDYDAQFYYDGWMLLTCGVYELIDSITVKNLQELQKCLEQSHVIRIIRNCETGYGGSYKVGRENARLDEWFAAAKAFLKF